MKGPRLSLALVLTILVGFADSPALAEIPIVWQTDIPSQEDRFAIVRVKLTPAGDHLMVFHYTGGPGWVEKLDVGNGQAVWQRDVPKPGEKLTANGWVDGDGNLYIMPTWSGYRFWKYDSELVSELCEYTPNSSAGFEYVQNIITDDVGNVYATGYVGSSSGGGSKIVKFAASPCGTVVWEHLSQNTSGKDEYTQGLAIAFDGTVYRVGMDRPNPGNGFYNQGRLLGHDADDGHEILSYAVPESNSGANGVLVDPAGNIYIAYTYDIYDPSGSYSEQERTVVQKLDQQGNVVWEYRFPDIGMYLSPDALAKHTDSSFYLAFQLRQGEEVYPGIAEFSLDGALWWQDIINCPGWGFARSGFDVANGTIYVGLTRLPLGLDADESRALALSAPPDCNSNGVPDNYDIASSTSNDCNSNGIPDECDILSPVTTCCEAHPEPGCDSPSIETCVCLVDPYCCDTEWDRVCVDEVTSEGCGLCDNDCNSNSIPDDCEPDFDGDGLIDDCDGDIDDDGVPNDDDVCDYTPLGTAVDSEGRPLGDIDKDCDTDLADYALFQDGFTGPLP